MVLEVGTGVPAEKSPFNKFVFWGNIEGKYMLGLLSYLSNEYLKDIILQVDTSITTITFKVKTFLKIMHNSVERPTI